MTRKQRKLYPSQLRPGDVLTLHDYTEYRPVTKKIEVTAEPYEGRKGHFTRDRYIEVPVARSHATMWRDTLTYIAKRRIEVERPTDA